MEQTDQSMRDRKAEGGKRRDKRIPGEHTAGRQAGRAGKKTHSSRREGHNRRHHNVERKNLDVPQTSMQSRSAGDFP